MKRKVAYFIIGLILLWVLAVAGFEAAVYYYWIPETYAFLIGENVDFLIEREQEKHIPAMVEDLSEELESQTEAQDKEQEMVEDRQREVCELLIAQESSIDAAFADFLYENYPEVCENICMSMQNQTYDRTLWYEQTGKSLFVLRDEAQGFLESATCMEEHGIYAKSCAKSDVVSLSFAGDISFANDYAPAQNYNQFGIDGAFSEELQDTMKTADIFMLNNEFCYSTGGTPVPKGYNFRANPEKVSRLEEMGVDIVSIANNHAYDYGAEAFMDTIATLNDAHMPYVGGGENLEDAKNHIVYFIANGIKIGYIAACQVERDAPIFTQPATEELPGVVRCFEPDLVVEMIKQAKEQCDFVIVYPHWGTELVTTIQEDQQALAHAFIDAGADVIVGGHPHCLQGVEYYQGIPIFYSMSNFSFSSKSVNSCILNLQISIEGIKQAQYIPCMESGGKTHQCDYMDADYARIVKLLNDVSKNADIDDTGIVTEKEETDG